MTPVEEQLNRIEAMVRVLMDSQRPFVTFGEIHNRLGFKARSTTTRWIKDNKIGQTGPRTYRFIDYISAATRRIK
jgi:hypothetical protein